MARLRIDGEDARQIDDRSGLDRASQRNDSDRRTGLASAGNVRARDRLSTIDVRGNVLIHRVGQTERIDHHAGSKLLGERGLAVEQTGEALHERRVERRREDQRALTIARGAHFIEALIDAGDRCQCGRLRGRSSSRRADAVERRKPRQIKALAVDFVGNGRHCGLQLRFQLRQRQRALVAGEVEVGTALRQHDRHSRFDGRLRHGYAARPVGVARRLLDVDGRTGGIAAAHVRTEFVLPVAVYVGSEAQHVFEDRQRLFGNDGTGNERIAHGRYSLRRLHGVE